MEQYLLLAKGLRGLALAELIQKATAETGLYGFGELLTLSQVQSLESDAQNASSLNLLRLFAYGTWNDYTSAGNGQFPALSPQQQRKLRALSVATLAAARRTLPYDELLSELQLASVRELEDLLISDCIYGGVIKGRLDQRRRCLLVEDALARDVRPERIGEIADALEAWLHDADQVLRGMDEQAQWVSSATVATDQRKSSRVAEIVAQKDALRAGLDAGGMIMGVLPGSGDAMDASMDADAVLSSLEGVREGDGPGGAQRVSKRRR